MNLNMDVDFLKNKKVLSYTGIEIGIVRHFDGEKLQVEYPTSKLCGFFNYVMIQKEKIFEVSSKDIRLVLTSEEYWDCPLHISSYGMANV